jgi:hypothetical protein
MIYALLIVMVPAYFAFRYIQFVANPKNLAGGKVRRRLVNHG